MREPKEFFEHLKKLQFNPATILDVGVAWGTPDLVAAFPNAYFHLFEPLELYGNSINSMLKKHAGEWHKMALANRDGEETIWVGHLPLHRAGASIFHVSQRQNADPVKIALKRMDDVLGNRELKTPLLLKIDAQGADIEVIKGGQKILEKCSVVIVETGMFPFKNVDNQLYKVVCHMASCGFALYDLLSPRPRPYDGALGQIDAVFVPENSPFRSHPHWA